ncbi:hypothetical protein R6Q59_020661 [Mikania micrantha]
MEVGGSNPSGGKFEGDHVKDQLEGTVNVIKDNNYGPSYIKSKLFETVEHLFVTCRMAQYIWEKISEWCRLEPLIIFSLNDLADVSKLGSGSKKWKKMIHAVCVTTLWCIWRHRNKIVFKSQSSSNNNLLEEICTLSFLWVKNRAKLASLSWDQWCDFDVSNLVV